MPDRWLLRHDESDCLFEVHTLFALRQCTTDGCDDVTGIKEFESQYQRQKAKEKTMAEGRRKITRRGSEDKVGAEPADDPRPLHVKYRPQLLSHIVGHEVVVESLLRLLEKKSAPHSFLFTGEKGLGKTTFARILAKEFQCDSGNIVEIDAAVQNSVDDMRALSESIVYKGLGATGNKMYIIDECHMLSKQAWGALLKAVEEPPEHVYFCFCTTETGKVPDTIESRCISYALKPLRISEIKYLLTQVVISERLDTPTAVTELVAEKAQGSARLALTMLQKVIGTLSVERAEELLEDVSEESVEIIDFCRLLLDRKTKWADMTKVITRLKETTSPESVRIVVVNYLAGCLMRARSDNEVTGLLDMLAQFSKPCNPTDKWAPILLALGNIFFPGS